MFRCTAATGLIISKVTVDGFTKPLTQYLIHIFNFKRFHQNIVRKNDLSVFVENAKNKGERAKDVIQVRDFFEA